MSETKTSLDVSNVAEDPLLAGGLMGVGVGVVQRFFIHFELPTLAVGLFVVGLVLSGFGDRSSVDVGRALTAIGVTSFFALHALVFIFG